MRIAIISDLETSGGAAVAASRLALGLLAQGHEVIRIVFSQDEDSHPWRTIELAPGPFRRVIARGLRYRHRVSLLERYASLNLRRVLAAIKPDLVSLHNLHAAAPYGWSSDFLRVSNAVAPTVATLHDMWSFTGRCAYNFDCRQFETGCSASCPTTSEYPQLVPRQVAGAWKMKRTVLDSNLGVCAVAPSRWLAQEARAGLWRHHRVEHIPYGLPLDRYTPVDRRKAREILGLDPDRRYVLVASQRIEERRKGGHLLGPTLSASAGGFDVLALGSIAPDFTFADPSRLHAFGYVTDASRKIMLYNAADVLLHPAPVDNLPNVVMEAIACGTPVVGFDTGGVGDMVRPATTGWLAPAITSRSLAETLDQALTEIAGGEGLRERCRSVAEEEYSLTQQADRYVELARSISRSSLAV